MLAHAAMEASARRELRTGRDPAQRLLARDDALAERIPAVVELPVVLVGPLLGDVVRAVRRAGRPVHEERLVGRERAVALQPRQGAIGQIFREVVRLVVRRLDRAEVLVQPRLPLRGLAGQKAVEVVEPDALAGRPAGEGAHRRRLGRRGVVPLAEGGGLVAVGAQHLREGGRGPRDHPGVAVPVHRALGDRAGADALMIAAGQERRARGRADRRRVEGVVADALARDARERWRVDRPAVGVGQAEADVVQHDDEDVGRILGQSALLHAPLVLGILQPRRSDAGRRGRRERQDGAVRRVQGPPGSMALDGSACAETQDHCHGDQMTQSHGSLSRLGPLRRILRRRARPEARSGLEVAATAACHFLGRTGFRCGSPLSSMSKSGSKRVCPCAPR